MKKILFIVSLMFISACSKDIDQIQEQKKEIDHPDNSIHKIDKNKALEIYNI